MSEISFTPFTAAHLDGAVALSRQASWPHRAEDWAMLAQLSTGFVALDGAQVVGTAFCTAFGAQVATLNMIIVDENMRGRGVGRKLMQAVMQAAGSRQMRLIATTDGLPLYKKLGFVRAGEIVQHQGAVPAAALTGAPQLGISWAKPKDQNAIVALDHAANGLDRTALFGLLFAQGRVAVYRDAGQPVGFAICRDFGRSKVIGPIVARTSRIAQTLILFQIAAQIETHPETMMRIDTDTTSGLAPWLTDLGMVHVGGGIVMRHGAADLSINPDLHIFALTNQALS